MKPKLTLFTAACLGFLLLYACTPSEDDHSGPSSISDYTIIMSAFPETIPADGESESIITVIVEDKDDEPVSGVSVVMTATEGDLTEYQYDEENQEWTAVDIPLTNGQGMVYAVLRSSFTTATSKVTAVVEDADAAVYVNFI